MDGWSRFNSRETKIYECIYIYSKHELESEIDRWYFL